MKVGFIGLGSMGSGMAARLLEAGHEVTVYNRTPEKAKPLVAQGARLAATVAEACAGEVVVTMLANNDAVEKVVLGNDGVLRHLAPRALHISSSTIGVRLAQRLHAAHLSASQRFICATVFGRPDVAAAGRLLVVAAGARADVQMAVPLLEAIGRETFVVSKWPHAATLVKLGGNFLIAAMIESLGEAMALVERGGVDRQRFAPIVSTLFDCAPYKTYAAIIADGKFQPAGFAAPLGAKDIHLALAAADEVALPMPIARLLRERFAALLAGGGGQLDWSAISQLAAVEGASGVARAVH